MIKLKGLTIRLEDKVHTDLKILCAMNDVSIQKYTGNFVEDSIRKEKEKLVASIKDRHPVLINLGRSLKEMSLIRQGRIRSCTRGELWQDDKAGK